MIFESFAPVFLAFVYFHVDPLGFVIFCAIPWLLGFFSALFFE